ncbi:hypothetical protein SADUNF_Sadunf10G0099600 [Salix dunnii]|uniref:Uncharacterized protein n=1 Tax=Salix dunnii TaxID=1413687 RepID=A0A835JT57_9ROSI|nr:hypothetical protein SADUNF_Sadunf10G0099600 [Salix dunnii]
MYVTRPLSMYLRDPSALSLSPPEGPSSGILVIQDDDAEPTCCFGLVKSTSYIKALPFPQNKSLTVLFPDGDYTECTRVLFIPVLDRPLSSKQYHVIQRKWKHKGKAYINSKIKEGVKTSRSFTRKFCLEPQSLDPRNIYQRFEIRQRKSGGFVAKSVASDGLPPEFLRRDGWELAASTPKEFHLNEAPGLNTALRACLPDFNFPLSQNRSEAVKVGKWYCPFMFIKEGTIFEEVQMRYSSYYEMTLEQQWEQIFACESMYNADSNTVSVDVAVECQVIKIAGTEAVHDQKIVADGVMWFRSVSEVAREINVGMGLEICERMRWEEERVGWAGGSERQVSVQRAEEFDGEGEWTKFGCYVLVERFALKRMDESVVLTFDFRHAHQIRSKWE